MINNIKVDLIYYLANKDFEFEFNLCSACQLRLLTDNPTTAENLTTSLARGFARSKVVIITAPFNDKLIEDVASLIDFETIEVNAAEYNIQNSTASIIISDAIPLVTRGGSYVGAILESGPQSLIILTDDKEARKEIMFSLVKPYIADLSRLSTIVDNSTDDTIEEIAEPSISETRNDAVITPPITVSETELKEEETTETNGQDTNNEILEQEEFFVEEPSEEKIAEPRETEESEENIEDIPNNIPEQLDYDDTLLSQNVDNVFYTKGNHRKVSPIIIVLLIILFSLLAFIAYTLIIEPLINDVPILENFKNTFGFLFA